MLVLMLCVAREALNSPPKHLDRQLDIERPRPPAPAVGI